MIYLQLFFEFFKAGLFAIGGGLATIPFLTDIGQRTGWFTSGELANMIAISESTPGPMGVNMATYVGFHTGGIAGGVIATLGLVCPLHPRHPGHRGLFEEVPGEPGGGRGVLRHPPRLHRPYRRGAGGGLLHRPAEPERLPDRRRGGPCSSGRGSPWRWSIFVCLQVKPLKNSTPSCSSPPRR